MVGLSLLEGGRLAQTGLQAHGRPRTVQPSNQ